MHRRIQLVHIILASNNSQNHACACQASQEQYFTEEECDATAIPDRETSSDWLKVKQHLFTISGLILKCKSVLIQGLRRNTRQIENVFNELNS